MCSVPQTFHLYCPFWINSPYLQSIYSACQNKPDQCLVGFSCGIKTHSSRIEKLTWCSLVRGTGRLSTGCICEHSISYSSDLLYISLILQISIIFEKNDVDGVNSAWAHKTTDLEQQHSMVSWCFCQCRADLCRILLILQSKIMLLGKLKAN